MIEDGRTLIAHDLRRWLASAAWQPGPADKAITISTADGARLISLLSDSVRVRNTTQIAARLAARHNLSTHEWKMLTWILSGHRMSEIAGVSGLGKATIKWHKHNLLIKTGAEDIEGLFQLALRCVLESEL